jgi:DNA-binding IclR family transcriptional regulator
MTRGAAVEAPNQKSQGVVDKAAQILMAFTFTDPELDLREIAKRVGLNKSTACRILKQLSAHNLIEQSASTGLYRLGIRLFELGSLAADNLRYGDVARPYLEALTAETGEASHFAILEGSSIIHLVRIESPKAVRAVTCRLGERYPFHCLAVGKAIAAHLPESKIEALLDSSDLRKFTERTITKRAGFNRELERVRRNGYAVDDEEFMNGVRCIGAPVRGYKGRVLGAINVVGPAISMPVERIAELAPCVVKTAAQIANYFSKDSAANSLVA